MPDPVWAGISPITVSDICGPANDEPLVLRARRAYVGVSNVGTGGFRMRRAGGKFGLVLVVALALVPTALILPAAAAQVPWATSKPVAWPSNAQARVFWQVPGYDGGSPITGYSVSYGDGTSHAVRVFNSTATTQIITGLTNGVTYYFNVAAINAVGQARYSISSAGIVVGTPAPPALPVVAPGAAQVRLNWKAPTDSGSAITGYIVTPYVGPTPQAARVYKTPALAALVAGLTNGVSFTFKVQAKNAVGTGPMSVASVAVKPTAQPTLETVMNATIGQPIIVNSAGMTVYMYVPDADASPTVSNVTGVLRGAWPYVTWGGPVTVGSPLVGGSAAGNVQPDNTRLVGYNGHLLYTFVSDHTPGQVTGQGVNQFFVLDASGNKIP